MGQLRRNPDTIRSPDAANHLFGWMGTVLLLGILPIKFLRILHHTTGDFLIGIAPSVLGPAGLLFLLLSSSGRISRLNLKQVTMLVAVVSLTLELVQALPRRGLLSRVHYTFDYKDLVATIVGVVLAYFVAAGVLRRLRPADET
jgi:hypothetical protein